MKRDDVTTDDVDEVPAELRQLRDILGAYARDVLGWYSLDDVADDDLEVEGGVSKKLSTPMGLPDEGSHLNRSV